MTVQIPAGYKQTEVGVIPEDWCVAQFSQVSNLITCGIAATPKYVPENIGFPFLSSANVKNGKISWKDYKHIESNLHHQLYKNNPPKLGDILYSRVGTIGEAAVIDVDFQFSIYVSLTLIKPKVFINSYFLAHLLNSYSYRLRAKEQVYLGGGVGNLNVDVVRKYPILFPKSLEEQQAIADALSDADALIESLEQLIAKKRQIKQGAMQELLTGQRRLPGFSGEWKTTTLSKIAANKKEFFDDGDWIESEYIIDDGIRLVQTGNIGIGEFVEKDDKKYISEKSFEALKCKEVKVGDLLICRLAEPAGRACVFPNIGEDKVVTSVDVTIFRAPSAFVNRNFLSYLFSFDQWFKEVSEKSGGTTHKRISRGALGNIEIKIPELCEQEAIASIFQSIDIELKNLEMRLSKARQIKQGMMQELLTGRIRLIQNP